METILPNRGVLAVSGEDRVAFLQGLVTNDVTQAAEGRAVYACLLSPQGRFLHDFFIAADGERLLLDCEADRRDDLLRRLKMFRLRAKVEIADETERFQISVSFNCHCGQAPDLIRGATRDPGLIYVDPRHPRLGFRLISSLPAGEEQFPISSLRAKRSNPGASAPTLDCFVAKAPRNDDRKLGAPIAPHPSGLAAGQALPLGEVEEYDRLRISLGAPDGSRDMKPGEALPMENNIEALNGIAWSKGCYVGQELTARMKYKAVARKRLAPVALEGPPVAPGAILLANGKEAGEMRSSCGDIGLALLRLDAEGEIRAGETVLTRPPHSDPA